MTVQFLYRVTRGGVEWPLHVILEPSDDPEKNVGKVLSWIAQNHRMCALPITVEFLGPANEA